MNRIFFLFYFFYFHPYLPFLLLLGLFYVYPGLFIYHLGAFQAVGGDTLQSASQKIPYRSPIKGYTPDSPSRHTLLTTLGCETQHD